MPEDESSAPTPHHHHRRRRAKWWLRFMPRRAALHRYPVIGSFAHHIRARDYLWSFRKRHVRPAYYVGSVLSLLPVMGVQLPVALVLSFVFRANFMVLGGLQLITNPLTAAPIYYGTYQLGKHAIAIVKKDEVVPARPVAIPEVQLEESEALATSLSDKILDAEPPRKGSLKGRVQAVAADLIVGGVIAGLVLGLCLDLLDRALRARAAHHHPSRPPRAPPAAG